MPTVCGAKGKKRFRKGTGKNPEEKAEKRNQIRVKKKKISQAISEDYSPQPEE